jgi:hypothetical protein
MRHIKKGDLLGYMPDTWIDEAERTLAELKTRLPEERSEFINKNYKLWSKLKLHMARISHEKCWYSEARLAISELEIDHFRPKNQVTGAKSPHNGYWWLAFTWSNFRLAYSLINKRRRDAREGDMQGKGCYFPLLNEDDRVPDIEPCDTSRERPVLIDPCVKSDVALLGYDVENGKVVEAFGPEHQERYLRANRSIDLYHLNEGTLIRDRAELYTAMSHLMDRVERLCTVRETVGLLNEEQEEEYDSLINQLGNFINSASPFSAFARACLQQRGERGWNTNLLLSA